MTRTESRLRDLLLRTRSHLTHRPGCVIETPWSCGCGLYQLLTEIEFERVTRLEPVRDRDRRAG